MTLQLSLSEVNRIASYCSEEVRRQYAYEWDSEVPLRVGGMIEAWLDALKMQFYGELITPEAIMRWGGMIEPRNTDFRKVPIYVGHSQKMKWTLVPRAIEQLCNGILEEEYEALAAYREFEEIHPFLDGNGRTGKIILNFINGSLLEPVFPPSNFWGRETINP